MLNGDGSAVCDRCGLWLPGSGVVYGLLCSDLFGAEIGQFIFCYDNDCRSAVLLGNTNYVGDPDVCTRCGTATARSVSAALLASDVDPVDGTDRRLTFCYLNGCRNHLLDLRE